MRGMKLEIFTDIAMLLFPRCCTVCGRKLLKGEELICTPCQRQLPKTTFSPTALNPMLQRFIGSPAVRHATSYIYYERQNAYSRLITEAKYGDRPDIIRRLARMAADELLPSGFFDAIDVILPVPLSARRKRHRGYNQSEWIARGISDVTGLPVDGGCLIRRKDNKTQTTMNRDERWQNVQGIFALRHPERLAGKTILLVDDVTTTGATLMSCIDTLSHAVPDIQISLFTLARTRKE